MVGLEFSEAPFPEFTLTLKKPVVIGALKFGLTSIDENEGERNEDDDACLEINVKLTSTKTKTTDDIVSIKFDKFDKKDTSIEDLDKHNKVVRCNNNKSYHGD